MNGAIGFLVGWIQIDQEFRFCCLALPKLMLHLALGFMIPSNSFGLVLERMLHTMN
jgi:hypothetical protein